MRFRLQQVLDDRGITTYELGKRLKGRIGVKALYRLANGINKTISLSDLTILCEALDAQPGDFFEPVKRRRAR